MSQTNTTEKAATYTAAAKVARAISIEELAVMLDTDDNPRIYRYGKATRIAMSAKFYAEHQFVGFDYCNRNGYTCTDGISRLWDFTKGRAKDRHGDRQYNYRSTVFEFDTEEGFDYVMVLNPKAAV